MPTSISLGRVLVRAEAGALFVSPVTWLRISSNRFFPPLISQIEDGISSTARSPEGHR